MTRDDIRAKVQELLRDILDNDEIVLVDDMVASDVLDWDSTNHVRLIVALEEDFGIRFETEEIAAPESVGELVDLVASKLR